MLIQPAAINGFFRKKAEEVTTRWKELGEHLFIKYLDGNVKKEKNGNFERNPYGQPAMPDFPGYNATYYRNIVKETGDKFKITQSIHEKH
jgi:hypothetical protein